MNFRTLVFRSLKYRFRSHLGVILGAAVGGAALVGALVVGDSVRESLHSMAVSRLGKVDFALDANDRFFRSHLAHEISEDVRVNSIQTDRASTPASAAAVLKLPGIATSANGAARANHIQVLGVDSAFWKLAPTPQSFENLATDTMVLNGELAQQLHAVIGDTVVVRVQKPGALSRDAVISPQNDLSIALRLKVAAIVDDSEFGRFGLQASQLAPFNAFVNIDQLGLAVGQAERANLLLFSKGSDPIGVGSNMAMQSLDLHWQLADGELEVHTVPQVEATELRSRRVFLEPSVVKNAKADVSNAAPILTYMVNELRDGEFATPYSMVTATGEPFVPARMRDDQILLNQWAADDLHATTGDTVSLKYFVMGSGRVMEEKQTDFHVFGIVPLSGQYADRTLMPDFPGIAEAESSSDWDGGFAIDMKKLRPKDEQYWKAHRGTPKAFVTLATGEKLWSNRFGSLTALRFPPNAGTADELANRLRQLITPRSLGLAFEPVRQQALDASAQAQDFGGLFIGFSFFLIIAALILMGLLFQFSVEQRATEIGTLLGLGFRPAQIRRLLLMEGALLSAIGSVLGIAGGVVYARAMLTGLMTLWRGAVGTSSLNFHIAPESLVYGAVGSSIMALVPIWLTLRQQARQPVRELLAGNSVPAYTGKRSRKGMGFSFWLAGVTFAGAVALMGYSKATHESNPAETFFSVGSLLLISFIAASGLWLDKVGTSTNLGLVGLAMRGCGRRRKRSLATIGLLGSGVFLIVSIGAFRVDANRDALSRSSGTGGFALLGEAAFPVTHDLDSRAGRDFHGLSDAWMKDIHTVAFRVHAGDEASCLNLNRAQKPRLLGVNPQLLAQRGAFAFSEMLSGYATGITNGWQLLETSSSTNSSADQAIPAIADENSILWAMGKKVGDTLDYTDARGNTFQVRLVGALANSVLQGNIIISETEFLRHFPDESGYRMFLFDGAGAASAEFSTNLGRAMQDVGLELIPAVKRLDEYNAVQNTYLNTFQALGGLGLLLGSAGLGVVVLRTVHERRSELAALVAVGFRTSDVAKLVLIEHALLLVIGLLVGTVAALVAVLPLLLSAPAQFPVVSLGFTLLAIVLNGLFCTWLATRFALRGNLITSLRSE